VRAHRAYAGQRSPTSTATSKPSRASPRVSETKHAASMVVNQHVSIYMQHRVSWARGLATAAETDDGWMGEHERTYAAAKRVDCKSEVWCRGEGGSRESVGWNVTSVVSCSSQHQFMHHLVTKDCPVDHAKCCRTTLCGRAPAIEWPGILRHEREWKEGVQDDSWMKPTTDVDDEGRRGVDPGGSRS